MTKRIVGATKGLMFPVDPESVPENGSITMSFNRTIDTPTEGDRLLTEEDLERGDWQVEKQGPNGFSGIDEVRGRPYKPELRKLYGPGKYRITPLDRARKPIETKALVELVGDPLMIQQPEPPAAPAVPAVTKSDDDIPAWMRLMMAQQTAERAEAQKRAEMADMRRQEWERQQAEREWARQEREERERRSREEREIEERRMANERTNQLLMAGMTLAKEFAVSRSAPKVEAGVNDVLLSALLRERDRPQPMPSNAGSLKETLDLLVVLDTIAQQRADRNAPVPSEPEEPDLSKTLMSMLPMLMAGRTGGAGVDPAALEGAVRQMAEGSVRKMLADPKAIAQYASQDPEGIAKVFLAAVKENPTLEKAVVKVLSDDAGDDEGE